jgi:hypothetical protein
LHLQHTRHQLSLDGAELHGLYVHSGSPVATILCIYVSLQVKPCFIRKECKTADGSHLRQQTIETNGKNEPCLLVPAARCAWITIAVLGLNKKQTPWP